MKRAKKRWPFYNESKIVLLLLSKVLYVYFLSSSSVNMFVGHRKFGSFKFKQSLHTLFVAARVLSNKVSSKLIWTVSILDLCSIDALSYFPPKPIWVCTKVSTGGRVLCQISGLILVKIVTMPRRISKRKSPKFGVFHA